MFAVIRSGGKQYRVSVGDVLTLEKLGVEAGQSVDFSEVLLMGDAKGPVIGSPSIPNARVRAEVLSHERGPKLLSFKRRRRKASSKSLRGHRQALTRVRITEISAKAKRKTKLDGKSADAKSVRRPRAPAESLPMSDSPDADNRKE